MRFLFIILLASTSLLAQTYKSIDVEAMVTISDTVYLLDLKPQTVIVTDTSIIAETDIYVKNENNYILYGNKYDITILKENDVVLISERKAV